MDHRISSFEVRTHVRRHYGSLAAGSTEGGACCGPGCGCGDGGVSLEHPLYSPDDLKTLPDEAVHLSLGCGNPVALASLKPGQVVVDLGSGGGIDCFLAADRVGQEGRVIGIDMTPTMIDAARRSRLALGLDNVEFRLGEIEHLPLADRSVDVVISNCVINLSPDKLQVLKEVYRVLRPGGRLAVSDVVASAPIPAELKSDPEAWAGCLSGAIETGEFADLLGEAGFVEVVIQSQENLEEGEESQARTEPVYQAFISARKE
jgi:ubiquinone/menaquinone biosynthesis C-methylase UbiE